MTKAMSNKPGATPQRRRHPFITALPWFGVVFSLLLMAWPLATDLYESWKAKNTVSTLSSVASLLPEEAMAELVVQAQSYNARLAGEQTALPTEQIWPYEQQLRYENSNMLSWLEIPSINVNMPIYHGTDEPQLSAGVGHLETSSLPVGGASTHCALTAHSGASTQRMFDDLRLLEPGDVFVVHTLGDLLAYEVVGSEVVLPDSFSSLAIRPGEDLCTLITCTPYGVNSHRLLVHARRCAYEPEVVAEEPVHMSSRDQPLIWAMAGIAVAAFVCVFAWWLRKRRKRQGLSRNPKDAA